MGNRSVPCLRRHAVAAGWKVTVGGSQAGGGELRESVPGTVLAQHGVCGRQDGRRHEGGQGGCRLRSRETAHSVA
eukprot:3940008-Rhodomonas_salina.1